MSTARQFRSVIPCFLVLLAVLISGCGGGGGNSVQSGTLFDPAANYRGVTTAAVLTPANAESLALSSFFGGDLGSALGELGRPKSPAPAAAPSVSVRELVQALKQATRRLAVAEHAARLRKERVAGVGKLAGRSSVIEVPGDLGGSATYTLELNDSTGSFYGSVVYHDFTSQGYRMAGSCDILGSFDLNGGSLTQMTLSTQTLDITADGSGSYHLSGSLGWTYTSASSSEKVAMNLVLADAGKTYWFKNYQITTIYGGTRASQTITGRYYDHDAGYLDLSTPITLEVADSLQWPTQGRFSVAAGNRWVRLSFQLTTLLVEADTTGDGLVDWQVVRASNPQVDLAPVVNAGPDQVVVLGNEVHLDGSTSSDPQGDTLSYSWHVTSWPANGYNQLLQGSDTATPVFTPSTLGTYVLELSVSDGSNWSRDTVQITVVEPVPAAPSALQLSWQYGSYGESIAQAGLLSCDLDGDGISEIIVSAQRGGYESGGIWYVVRKTSGGYQQVWRSGGYPAPIAKLLLADLNGDGRKDVVVALADGTICCYDGPTLQELPRLTLAASIRDLAIADLNGDGKLEIATTDGVSLCVFDAATGSLKWRKENYGGTAFAVGNVDADAALEIVSTGYGGQGYVIDGVTGALKWEYLNGFGARVRLADLDGDGKQEIIGASAWYKITIFDADLKSPAWEIVTDLDIAALEVVDTNDDGVPEILYGDGQWGEIHAIDARTHSQLWMVGNPAHGVSGIAYADVDQDGSKELIWGRDLSLFVANPAGGSIKWQNTIFSSLNTLALGDLNNDGSLQLLMVTANMGYNSQGLIHIFDQPSHSLAYQQRLNLLDVSGYYRGLAIGDLEGDGKNEFVLSTSQVYEGLIQVYDGATRSLKRQSAGYDGNFFSTVALGDVDGDGKMEIVAGQGRETTGAPGTYVVVFDAVTMQEKWKSVDLGSYWGYVYDLKLADLDKDGRQDIIFSMSHGSYNDVGRFIVYDGANHTLKLLTEASARALEVADLDGDGYPEVLVGRLDGRIDVYDGVSFSIKKTLKAYSTDPVNALAVADLDGDGIGEVLVATGGRLSVLRNGELYWRSGQLGSNLGLGNHIAVRDTDLDGHPNVFIGSGSALYQFKYTGP
jgi:hypothetical protein